MRKTPVSLSGDPTRDLDTLSTRIEEQLLSPRIHKHVPRVEVPVPEQAVSRSLPRSPL